jgi:hypothetical protein
MSSRSSLLIALNFAYNTGTYIKQDRIATMLMPLVTRATTWAFCIF